MVAPWLLLLSAPLPALAAIDKTHGVAPALISRYTPSRANTWTCLDGSKEIPWAFVNDDSCDCPDGSDEPGTGACPNTTFYCQNKGHIGANIPSSRVNDGLCEPQCCDGSDERPGVCKNVCKEVGAAYRAKREEEKKLRNTGAKIRSTYIAFAQKEKKRLEGQISSLTQEISAKEQEVERLRDIAERTESLSAAALEQKKQSPLYKMLIEHVNAIKSLRREYKKHLEREKALGDILDALRTGYNPNYQDMAVLEAVRGWEQLAGLPHINDADKDEQATTTEAAKEEPEEWEEGMWTAEALEKDLDNLLGADHVSLLLAHEKHILAPLENSSFDFGSFLPEFLQPKFDDIKDTVVSWLEKLGIGSTEDEPGADATRARKATTEAEAALSRVKHDKREAETELSRLFEPTWFGREGEWKKLENLCLEKDTGEYTYEVCLFKEAKQKAKHGGTFSLGKFASWNPSDITPDQPEYYQKQIYNRGARCWNGPERNIILVLSCGKENELLSVTELEKCEYQFTATTPALCLPWDDAKERAKDEL
ncbi:hypothetical protein AX16_008497 [Volvariella volvacea WC 439]|nr:hypothetical protein AX16_008497 [Volvariella volvacea WC 439]